MEPWSNIDVSPQDSEILTINQFEQGLGQLPNEVCRIRELITRFEVCHFKYQHHLRRIKNSILALHCDLDPEKIGASHIRNGENAWKNDKTGRSLIGQQYVWAIREWLSDKSHVRIFNSDERFGQPIQEWLGDKNPVKQRLARLLLARLTWDWKPYEELQRGGEYKDLELQICSMDICHYAFPYNLDRLLQGMGEMRLADHFEGCGSFNGDIEAFIAKEIEAIGYSVEIFNHADSPKLDEKYRAWLNACLVKTLKEQIRPAKMMVESGN